MHHWFGIKSFPLPQKEQQVLNDRSTLWAKYSIYKGICTNITVIMTAILVQTQIEIKGLESLYAFKSHFLS